MEQDFLSLPEGIVDFRECRGKQIGGARQQGKRGMQQAGPGRESDEQK